MADTSGPWEQYRTSEPATGSDDGPWRNYGGAGPAPSGGTVSDLAKSIKVGVQRLPGMATGLADLPIALTTGARPFTKAADALGEVTGFQPSKWADETKFSAGHEQGKQAVDKAWQEGDAADIALSYLKNPGYTANKVAESLPGMVAGGLAGRALMGAGRIAAPLAEAGGGPGAPSLLARAVGEKMAAPVAAGVGEGAVTAGQQMQQYQGEDQQQNALAALGAGAVAGALSIGAGRVANKLGLETAETAIINAGRKGAVHAADEVPLSAKRRILGGMVSEALLQELPQSAQEQMWQNWADGKPLMEGVARAAAEGAIAGGVMGAGANVSDGGAGKRRAQAGQQAEQARQVAEAAAADARAKADAAVPPWTTTAGAAGPSAEPATGVASDANAPGVADAQFTTSPGAAEPREGGMDFTRDVDTSGLSLEDPAEVERARAATVDYEPGDATPQWSTERGAAPARQPGLDMPGPEFDTSGMALEGDARTPSQRLGIDPASGPLSKAAATVVDSGAAQEAQFIAATGRNLQVRRSGPGVADESSVIDVQGRVVDDRAISTPRRLTSEQGGSTVAQPGARAEQPALPPPGNLREYLDRGRAQREAAARAAQSASTVTGVLNGPQADQAQQAAAQPAQGGAAQAAALAVPGAQAVRGSQAQAIAGAPTAGALTDGAPAQDDRAQAAPTEGTQGQAQAPVINESLTTARPEGWRKSMLKAGPVARGLGLDPKGKRLAQLVAEIDAADAQRAGVAQDGADLSAGQIDREWSAFAPETGTLGVPRAEMPQIKAEHRGALVNFLKARGIDSRAAEVPANDLKPTQAEFSQAKVDRARAFKGGDRSILVSSDGYVVDGHHQWLAKRANGEPVKVIRLQAPIREVLAQVGEFPSTAAAGGVALANSAETTGVPDAATPRDLRLADERAPGAAPAAQAGPSEQAGRAADAQPDARRPAGRGDTAAAVAGVQPAVPAGGDAGQQAAGVAPQGREISREIGRYKQGLSEFRANQVRAELARQNPGVVYTVEEDAALKNGFAVVGREPAPGGKLALQKMQAARGRPADGPMFSRAPRRPQDFVPNADGGLDYGEITPEMGKAMRRQAGVIRLQQGVQNADGSGYGLAHIESRHGRQIHGLGYGNVADFVADALGHMDAIWQPGSGTSQMVVVQAENKGRAVFIQLAADPNGGADFYVVNTAFPIKAEYASKRKGWKELWSRVPVPADNAGASSSFADPAAEKAGQQAAMDSSQSGASVPPKASDANFRRDDIGAPAMTPELAAALVTAARPPSADTRSAARRMSDERLVATQRLVDNLSERWARAPEIIVARHMQDVAIPQAVRDYDAKLTSQGGAGEVRGFVYRGQVFLLADNLASPRQIAETLFHEVLGHHGLRGAFGDRLDPVLKQVGMMRRADVVAKARSYGLVNAKALDGVSLKDATNAQVWAAMSEGQRLQAAEEVLAEMAEQQPQLGFVQRAVAAIRTFLRELGLNLRLTDADIIRNFLTPAREFVTRQGETVEQAIDRAMVAFNNGQFDQGNPDIRFSRSAPTAGDYTPEQARAAERVFGVQKKQTWAERAQSFRANLGTKLRQGLVDQFAPIKEVSEKAYVLARLSKGSDGAVEAALLYGKPFLRDGVYDVDIKDGGFAKVLAGLKGEETRFLQWVAAQRSERLKAEGKENLLTDKDITALKTLNAGRFADGTPRMPAYAAALRELNAFNEATLKVAMESGLIDQAAYELMKEQPYVPFYRLMEDGDMRGPRFSSGLVNQQAWKKLKGGTEQLNADLLQNLLLNWSHLYAAAARNRASLETMAAADRMGIAYQVPADTKGAVKVMRDGVAEHWAVEDPYLLDAISAMSYAPPGIVKAMAPFKRLLTFGVTVNPTFKIRNLIRDSLSAMAQSDLSYNPAANVANGWKATSKESQTYASMLASGGIIKFGTQENADRVRAQIEKLGGEMLDKSGFDKLKGQMKSLWEAYEEFGDRTENVNRAALYERLIAKGHSHAEASFMARDLMDFSMSGKWETVRFLAQTVPFLNARLQGLYKLGRAAKEDPRRFAAMAGAVSLASLGLLAAYGDDDDWKKREDWDRDAYWWFKIGDKAFRIPKPFEVGAIGTLAERTAELMMSDEMTGKRFGQRISDMVFNTFAMDPTPQFIKPFIDVYANKDSFSGRPIEGMADERLRPQDRYNERTSEIGRLLGSWGLPDPVRLAKGEYSGLSPKQIDFLLRGYFGWLATVTTTAADMAARPLLDRGERPAMRLRDTFLAGNFVESLPTGGSRYVTAMYEQARDVEQAWASYQAAVKSGDMEKARSIQEEEAPKLRNRLAVANAKRQISELGQEAKRIESNRMMPAEEKRRRLDEIEARKHQAAQRVAVTG